MTRIPAPGFAMLFVLVLFVMAVVLVAGAGPASAAIESITTCASPQLLNPPQVTGLGPSGTKAVAFNGEDFAVIAAEPGYVLRFQRVYADGSPASSPVLLSAGGATYWETPALVWNGAGYGVAWVSPGGQVMFARLSTTGSLVSGPTNVSNSSGYCTGVTLAWSGSGYLVAWADSRNGARDVYGQLLDASGGLSAAVAISTATSDQQNVSVAWSQAGGNYVAVWDDYRTSSKYEIYSSTISTSGAVGVNYLVVTPPASSFSTEPRLRDSAGGGLGMAWRDYRDGNYEIYFAVLTPSGQKATADARLSTSTGTSRDALVVWTGGEWGVFFRDARGGVYDVSYQRVASAGTAVGGNTPLTNFAAVDYYGAAYASKGLLLAYGGSLTGAPTLAAPVGCATPGVPGCPEVLDAYNVSGTGVTLGWLPATDAAIDIAYYQVYRNAAPVGRTSRPVFSDTGLSAGTTYQYNVRAVNAAQLSSVSCPSAQVFVKSSAALSLSVERDGDDIGLSWTDADPATQNAYRVMRGTSPQVMTQIDSTTERTRVDPGAAVGSVCYFYSIDGPAATDR